MIRPLTIAAALLAAAITAPTATANGCPDNTCNAIQPSPVYFGQVKAGDYPTKLLTLTNHTGRKQRIRRFILAGAGGGRFTLTWKRATCRIDMRLLQGESCTLVVRVTTERVDYQETNLQVNYGRSTAFRHGQRGQWNAVVFARVVA